VSLLESADAVHPVQIIRRAADGALDEVVVSRCDVHVERMSEGGFWIGLSRGRRPATQTLHLHVASVDAHAVEAYISDDELGCREEEA